MNILKPSIALISHFIHCYFTYFLLFPTYFAPAECEKKRKTEKSGKKIFLL